MWGPGKHNQEGDPRVGVLMGVQGGAGRHREGRGGRCKGGPGSMDHRKNGFSGLVQDSWHSNKHVLTTQKSEEQRVTARWTGSDMQ